MVAQYKIDEAARLKSLRRLELLDTPSEPEFDELVEVAAAICEVPISLVSLLDEKRQWFKAAVGLDVSETAREVAFCSHTIEQDGLFLVEDAAIDPRFAKNPLVTGNTNIRFYAGVPLSAPDGQPLGSLCVIDRVPRTLTPTQLKALKVLGRQANARLELREQRRQMAVALEAAQEIQKKLAASENRFQTFMDQGPFISYLKDANGVFLYYNRLMAEHFAISRDAFIGKTDTEVFPLEMALDYRAHDREVLESGKLHISQETTMNPDGSTSDWRSYKFPFQEAGGRMLLGGVSLEVTDQLASERELRRYQSELEAANALLQELATTDPLTGIANRRVFDERLTTEYAQARRKGRALSVMMIDVDNFKRRNDLYGHAEGDTTLRRIAALLESSVRESDLVVRYGGEEFILLLPETDEAEAVMLGERIVAAVRSEDFDHEPVTVSAGVTSLQASTPDQKRLVNLADEALYAAKRAGKNCVIGYATYYQQVLAEMQKSVNDALARERAEES